VPFDATRAESKRGGETVIGAVIATIVSAIACGALVYGEWRGRRGRRLRVVAKPVASAAFIAVPLAGGALAGGVAADDPATWIVVGLVLGAIGDVLLLYEALFLAGLVVFLLGHVAYVVGFALVVPMAGWPRVATWPAMCAVAAGATALAWLWPHLGKMRVAVIAYVGVIVVMVIGGAAVALRGPGSPAHAALVFAGAAMFFASDLAVARDRFVAQGFVNRAWGLPVYYAAQLALGWSLLA
jgi:uncharacterized membrane protein YhhN